MLPFLNVVTRFRLIVLAAVVTVGVLGYSSPSMSATINPFSSACTSKSVHTVSGYRQEVQCIAHTDVTFNDTGKTLQCVASYSNNNFTDEKTPGTVSGQCSVIAEPPIKNAEHVSGLFENQSFPSANPPSYPFGPRAGFFADDKNHAVYACYSLLSTVKPVCSTDALSVVDWADRTDIPKCGRNPTRSNRALCRR
jgi:hypothetical protein